MTAGPYRVIGAKVLKDALKSGEAAGLMAAIEALSRDPRDPRLGVRPVKPTTGHQAYTVPVGQGLLLFVVDDADLLIRLEAFYWNL